MREIKAVDGRSRAVLLAPTDADDCLVLAGPCGARRHNLGDTIRLGRKFFEVRPRDMLDRSGYIYAIRGCGRIPCADPSPLEGLGASRAQIARDDSSQRSASGFDVADEVWVLSRGTAFTCGLGGQCALRIARRVARTAANQKVGSLRAGRPDRCVCLASGGPHWTGLVALCWILGRKGTDAWCGVFGPPLNFESSSLASAAMGRRHQAAGRNIRNPPDPRGALVGL